MFAGHFGIGFGAKAATNRTSISTLFFASQFIDLLWPTLLLLGLETVRISPGITAVTPLDFTHYPSIGFWALVAFLLVIYFGNIFGPPPPSEEALAWTSQAQWVLIGWAYWLDRYRESISINQGARP